MTLKHAKLLMFFLLPLLVWGKMDAGTDEDADAPVYLQYVDEITHAFEQEAQKDFGLIATGSGGSMPYNVREITIKFTAHRKASIEEARELEVRATEKLLKMINGHQKIRPYLNEYPFPASGATVSISFTGPEGNRYTDGSVAYVFQGRSKIFYCSATPNKQYNYDLVDLCEEPYEEALKIVQGSPPKRMQ